MVRGGSFVVRLRSVSVVFMDRLMRFEQLRVKAVFLCDSIEIFKRMPNAPVVGTPEKRERSDQRQVVLCCSDCVGVVPDWAIAFHRNSCLESHFIRCLLSYSETG